MDGRLSGSRAYGLIGRYVPHKEINADASQPLECLECVLVRSDNEAVVVNITDVEPVEKLEAVCWVDPIH